MKRGDILKGRLFYVHWNSSEIRKYAKDLRKEGWNVETEAHDGGRAFQRIRANLPDAVVINLDRLPAHGREIGFTLQAIKITDTVPVVFVDGEPKDREKTLDRVPNAVFATSEDLDKTLDKYSKEEEEKEKEKKQKSKLSGF